MSLKRKRLVLTEILVDKGFGFFVICRRIVEVCCTIELKYKLDKEWRDFD